MTWRSPNWNDGAHVWGTASPDSYRPRSDVGFERMESKTYRHRDFYDKFKSGT